MEQKKYVGSAAFLLCFVNDKLLGTSKKFQNNQIKWRAYIISLSSENQ